MSVSAFTRRGSRAPYVVGLLVGALGVAALLAYQAIDAGRSHAQVAEKSVREQAHFAAWEFTRSARAALEGKLLYPGVEALARAGGKDPGTPLRWEAFTEAAEAQKWDPSGITALFRVDLESGAVSFARRSGTETESATDPGTERETAPNTASATDPVPGLTRWIERGLGSHLERMIAQGWEPTMVRLEEESSHVVYRLFPEVLAEAEVVYGFLVPDAKLAESMLKALASPMLPEAVTDGRDNGDLFFVSVSDPPGTAVWTSGVAYASDFTARDTVGLRYGGLTTSVVVNPEVAPSLVIGGLPRQRLPLVFALLALSAGLVVTALIQVRRETELARLRADFVSGVSHELRTPLAQIRMFSETLLLGRVRNDEERRRSLEIIVNESRRLTHQVDNVLLYSRGERQGLRFAPAPVDLGSLVEEVVESFVPLAAAARCEVTLVAVPSTTAVAAPSTTAVVDAALVRQALLNLLDNAVKYGPPGQAVRVSMTHRAGRVLIRVDDEGPGVAEKERARIFEPYHRLSRDRESAVAGSGIGLSVVGEVARLHGGDARVEAGEGGGARFVLEIPLEPGQGSAT